MIILSITFFILILCLLLLFFRKKKCFGSFSEQASDVVIFDFDGTLCDSFKDVFISFNALSARYKFNPILLTRVEELRGLPSREIFRHLKISAYKLPWIVRDIRKIMSSKISSMELFEGMGEALKDLKSRGVVLGVLTSNSSINVHKFLSQNDIEYFDFVISSDSIFGKDRALKKIKRSLSCNKVFYVGDETRDIIAAKKSGVTAVAVSWGYNNSNILQRAKPHYILNKPSELQNLL